MKVNGKDDIPYMENKIHIWNHQPENSPEMSTACMTISSPRRQAGPKGHSEPDVPNEMGPVPPPSYGIKRAQR